MAADTALGSETAHRISSRSSNTSRAFRALCRDNFRRVMMNVLVETDILLRTRRTSGRMRVARIERKTSWRQQWKNHPRVAVAAEQEFIPQ